MTVMLWLGLLLLVSPVLSATEELKTRLLKELLDLAEEKRLAPVNRQDKEALRDIGNKEERQDISHSQQREEKKDTGYGKCKEERQDITSEIQDTGKSLKRTDRQDKEKGIKREERQDKRKYFISEKKQDVAQIHSLLQLLGLTENDLNVDSRQDNTKGLQMKKNQDSTKGIQREDRQDNGNNVQRDMRKDSGKNLQRDGRQDLEMETRHDAAIVSNIKRLLGIVEHADNFNVKKRQDSGKNPKEVQKQDVSESLKRKSRQDIERNAQREERQDIGQTLEKTEKKALMEKLIKLLKREERQDIGKVLKRDNRQDIKDRALNDKEMIVVSMPGYDHDSVYGDYYDHLKKFIKDLDGATRGYDDLAIVMDDYTWEDFEYDSSWLANTEAYICAMPNNFTLDAWIRDYSPIGVEDQVQFLYYPKYLDTEGAEYAIEGMNHLLNNVIKVNHRISDIILDGGNYIENGKDKAVLTERVFWDNEYDLTQTYIENEIARLMNKEVVYVEDPGGTTGHIDGIAAFISEDILLINECDYDEDDPTSAGMIIKDMWPNLEIVKLPCPQAATSTSNPRGSAFDTARFWYANALSTKNSDFIPAYGSATHDSTAFNTYKAKSNKPNVKQIDTAKISELGGSVRCLTWNIGGSTPAAEGIKKNCIKAKTKHAQGY